MRGTDQRSGELFSYVGLEQRVRADHPLRAIRSIVNEALETLSGEFAALYSGIGRPSIPPEMLLRAMLLQAFYSVRSERQLMERLEFDLLFRWFVGLGADEPAWDHSTFSKNRDRLLDGDIAARFLSAVLARPRVRRLLRKKIDLVRAAGADEAEVGACLAQIESINRERRKSSSVDPMDPNFRRLRYCRYADDFLVGVIGSKADAVRIMAEILATIDRVRARGAKRVEPRCRASGRRIGPGWTLATKSL